MSLTLISSSLDFVKLGSGMKYFYGENVGVIIQEYWQLCLLYSFMCRKYFLHFDIFNEPSLNFMACSEHVHIMSTTCPVSHTGPRHIAGRSVLILTTATNEIQRGDEVHDEDLENHCFMYLHTSGCDASLIATDDCLNDHRHMPIINVGPGLHRSAPLTLNLHLAQLNKPYSELSYLL